MKDRELVSMPINRDNNPVFESALICHSSSEHPQQEIDSVASRLE